jgi:hypothetical protein
MVLARASRTAVMEHASRSAKPLSRRVRVSSCAVAVTLLIFSRESALRPPRECTVRKSERFCSTSRRRGSISPIKKRRARRPSIVPEQQKAPTERGFSCQMRKTTRLVVIGGGSDNYDAPFRRSRHEVRWWGYKPPRGRPMSLHDSRNRIRCQNRPHRAK